MEKKAESILGRGMSPAAQKADIEQSDREYITNKQRLQQIINSIMTSFDTMSAIDAKDHLHFIELVRKFGEPTAARYLRLDENDPTVLKAIQKVYDHLITSASKIENIKEADSNSVIKECPWCKESFVEGDADEVGCFPYCSTKCKRESTNHMLSDQAPGEHIADSKKKILSKQI
jgi:endogenous inhibitor of DNA gyrase (YacG/DUF329 family)